MQPKYYENVFLYKYHAINFKRLKNVFFLSVRDLSRYAFSNLLLVSSLLAGSAWAVDYQVGPIHIMAPFSKALPPNSKNGAVYLTLINHGHQSDQLVGVTTPMAEYTEIHIHSMEDGMMKMRKVDSVDLPPHETVLFAPGGKHIMLIGLAQTLKEGENFPLRVHFKEAGHVSVEVAVKAVLAD